MAINGPNSQIFNWSLNQSDYNEGESIQISLTRSLATPGSKDQVWIRVDSTEASDFNLAAVGASDAAGASWIPVNFGNSLTTSINLPIVNDGQIEGSEFVMLGLSGEFGSWTTATSVNGITDWEVMPTSQSLTINDTSTSTPAVTSTSSPAATSTSTPAATSTPVLSDDYLNFTPQTLPARPFDATAKYFDYVDRYPLTLKTAFIADYNAGKAPSQALWGQQHWLNSGSKQGRVLEIVTGTEDINDYGAYVENYGTTLLDIYRASPDSNPTSETFKSLFNWGKDHYNTLGKAAGRAIDGGVDWGAIVKQNFDLFTKWQDAKITDPNLSAFAYGYRNQNVVKAANGVKVGRDTQEKLTGQYAYGMGGNDVLTGTASDDLLHGGFGDDLIAHGKGGTDLVYGGPGKDVFRLHSGGTLNIRDFRKGTDFIQLGDGMTDADVQLVFDGFNNATSFKKGSETLASVYGTNPNDFSFAQQSEGLDNVFIA